MNLSEDFINLALKTLSISRDTLRDGTAEIVAFLRKNVLNELDFDVLVQASDTEGPHQVNLEARKGPSVGPGWIFNTHLDAVPTGDPAEWTATGGNPFDPKIEGDKIYGRGSSDVTLDWLCKAWAFRKFRGQSFRCPVIFMGTYGEERGMVGARQWVQSQGSLKGWKALVGEPTYLHLLKDHKGFVDGTFGLKFSALGHAGPGTRIRFSGQAAHSSAPDQGVDAIAKAMDYIISDKPLVSTIEGGDAVNMVPASCDMVQLGSDTEQGSKPFKRLEKDIDLSKAIPPQALEATARLHQRYQAWWRRQNQDKDPDFKPPSLTGNVGTISATPQGVEFIFEFRTLPSQDPAGLSADLRADLKAWARDLPKGIILDVQIKSQAPGQRISEKAPFLGELGEVAKICGLKPRHLATPGCTEAGTYTRAGAQAIVFGPGPAAGNIHRPNEYNLLSQLSQAVEYYERVIETRILA